MRLNVFLNAYGKRNFVGVLEEQNKRIFFEYAPEFLRLNIPFSPFMLPLKQQVYEDEKYTFDGLFGVFNDSLPDGWDCLLLDRKLQKKGLSYNAITPLQRLSLIGLNAMGALEYEPADEMDKEFVGDIALDSLSMESGKILKGSSSDVLDTLLKLNGSSQGARPKIVALVSKDKQTLIHGNLAQNNYEPWLIKFNSTLDDKDIGAKEYIYSLMAKDAGIDMPETHLFPSQNSSGHFGVKRFDRTDEGKVHIHTACGLLHASHRFASLDYTALLKLTAILTKDVREVEKMVRLMIFNVNSGNKDDHSKNFSFWLTKDNVWKMTPAYDLTPSEGINGEQTSMVNGKGKNITTEDFIKIAAPFGFSEKKIREIVSQTADALSEYQKYAKDIGIK